MHFPDIENMRRPLLPLQAREAAVVSCLLRRHESDLLSFSHCACRPLCAQRPCSLCGPPAACSSPLPHFSEHAPPLSCCPRLSPLNKQWYQPSILYHFSSNNFFPPNAEQLLGQGLRCPHQSSRFCIHRVRAVGALGVKFWTPQQTDAILKPRVFRGWIRLSVLTSQLHHGSAQGRAGYFTGWNSWSH